ncbi:MAG: hypothetical protein HRT88_10265 [Lentisphaeraceae bacterium]|nr:hypothetical protein [Lentisphaeraceae bacterium]
MKEILKKNGEKVLLTALLVVLVICSAVQMLTIKEVKLDPPKPRGSAGPETNVEVPVDKVSVLLLNEGVAPFDKSGRVYCRKLKCNFLSERNATKCPICKMSIVNEIIVKEIDDKDRDGISNKFEIANGLDPEDPADALWDKDKDGFSNLDEFIAKTDISDKDQYPALINRVKYGKLIRYYYPFTLTDVTERGEGTSGWDIEIRERDNKGNKIKDRIHSLNEVVGKTGYKITDVGKKDEKYFATLKKEGEESITIGISKKPELKTKKYQFINELARKYHYAALNEDLKLKGKNGRIEIYTLKEYSKSVKALKFIDEQHKSEVFVKRLVKMQKPLADGERQTASDDTGDEIQDLERRLRAPKLR